MGIDIYARWRGQTTAERDRQQEAWASGTSGRYGYLREAYHGEPYVTRHLVPEAFVTRAHECAILASSLRRRLPEVLKLTAERERTLYGSSDEEVASVLASYRDFVDLCERKERETGEPVTIIASF